MIGKIIIRSLLIVLCALLVMAYRRVGFSDLDPANVVIGSLLVPIFATMMWLRWDWAPAERQRRRELEEQEK